VEVAREALVSDFVHLWDHLELPFHTVAHPVGDSLYNVNTLVGKVIWVLEQVKGVANPDDL
jgi:hypothetical protein